MNESNVIGNTIINLDSIESTNNYAEQLCTNSNPNHGTVITTRFQGAGRGQIGRKWHSTYDKNVLMSIIVRPSFLEISQQFFLSMTIALAIRDVIQDAVTTKKVTIKWPNDIYIDNKKVAGILIQSSIMKKSLKHCIIGIGVNINEPTFPLDIPYPTSLFLELGVEVNLAMVKDAILRSFNGGYSMLVANKCTMLKDAYESHLYLKGQVADFVRLKNEEPFTGIILGISQEGMLRILIDEVEQQFVVNEIKYLGIRS